MKSTGIIRRVDELGRIVIPIELRNKLKIAEKDPIEIYVDGSSIILRKFEPNCIFCGNSKKLSEYKGKIHRDSWSRTVFGQSDLLVCQEYSEKKEAYVLSLYRSAFVLYR